jgi:peptidyl-prolyl cis-trans isomerase A (cyclophilin A)
MQVVRRKVLLAMLASLMAAPSAAQRPAAGSASTATTDVILHTALGDIRIALDTARAPITAQNFLKYVDAGRLDGTTFYRALKYDKAGTEGLVQGGLQGSTRSAFPPIAHESTVTTGLSHVDGAVSMARGKPGSARGEFFIVIGSMINYDGVPNGGDPGFAVFGRVMTGMPVVRKMMRLPRAKEARSEHMQGQMLAEPVAILTARRVPP